MAFNKHPIRPITQDEIDTYERDGVVCLRQVFDRDWIDSLLEKSKEIVIDRKDFGLLPTMPGRYMARCIPEFRRFVFDSPLAEAAGTVMQSKEIRFFFDEFFAKPPQSAEKTIWHVDRMAFPVEGKMVPSLWIPLTKIIKENSLECIAGSQHQDVKYWLFSPNARKMIKPADRAPHPNCEPLRYDPRVKFLSWDMEPGDMLIVHPWTLHYSHGNSMKDWRIALSVRVFGDDITWAPRPDCLNIAGISFDEMLDGAKPAGSHLPLLWSEDGRAEGDVHYPRGFATSWPKTEMQGINEYKTFTEMKRKEEAGELEQNFVDAAE